MATRANSLLMIEDDIDVRLLLSEFLELEGFVVHQASNGQEALEALKRIETPSLILVDWLMPVMNGEEFLTRFKKLRSNEKNLAHVPVMVMSAFKASHSAGKIAKESGDYFLEKPINTDNLLKTLRSLPGY